MPIAKALKGHGGAWFKDAETADGTYGSGNFRIGVDGAIKGENGGWFNDLKRDGRGETGYLSRSGSKSSARKAASAHIAKIPIVLARHIARAWHPEHLESLSA